MNRILAVALLSFALSLVAADAAYDFRTTEAYRELSTGDKRRLEQVHRDLVLLWGALDLYADDHDGNPPENLDALVPKYLAELPSDLFVTQTNATLRTTSDVPSKSGAGYRFRNGSPGKRTWVISSIGLPNFPYLAERGNVGLYLCKGNWISGNNL